MAPKNLPPAAKQQKILDWFRETMGVYTFKELEKLVPAVAGINGMQVREYVQALQDEYLIRVEKIGSGNWYWCFTSDSKKAKDSALGALRAEEGKLRTAIADAEGQVTEEMARREMDEEMQEGGKNGRGREALLEAHRTLGRELEALDRELACYRDNDPSEVLRKKEETKRLMDSAIRWTDNIESIESLLCRMLGDRTQVAGLMSQACGEEYVMGEGLKEL